MAYPDNIDVFEEKLNKNPTGNNYVIEEQLPISAGVYDGPLRHDNINNDTVRVYTGSRFTGERVMNFTISIPDSTPWRRLIRIYTAAAEVYVTYETPGDTVEADDINVLQDAVTVTQTEINRYKGANDALVANTRTRLAAVESGKAEKTYVDTQLVAKADKSNTYTKTETDARIQSVVAAAPEALDTLKEIADALNNDPDFAGTMTTQLAGKVEKEAGKGLSANDYTTVEKTKLAGVAAAANHYVHPTNHPPSIITQDAGNRFVTDAEKVAWSAKETPSGAQAKADAVAGDLSDHEADNVRHITAVERTSWNAKASTAAATVSTAGLMSAADKSKLDGVAAGAQVNTVTSVAGRTGAVVVGKSDVGLSNVENYGLASQAEAESGTSGAKYMTPQRTMQAIQSQLASVGAGDMSKLIYDTNNSGIVDAAESVPWTGVSNKPATYPPSIHSHNYMPSGPLTWGQLKGV
ncbi:hypothetical protein J7E73_29990 [Paenibacillus albidus]|uniref:hypothetical protein n=1 Tax=Paenibacillus albidus TaxID=2041023 RepID=UPI001BE78661|nr:hypothetical protein [Paenibacillus albidus]MBT2293252.1 hypothetical protein [Paenibacillus albidus]